MFKKLRFFPTKKMFHDGSLTFKITLIVAAPALLVMQAGYRLFNHCRRLCKTTNHADELYYAGKEQEAFDSYRQQAEQGNTYAMGKAGAILYDSNVIKQNLSLAASYLETAANAGHSFAQTQWGRYLLINANDGKRAKPWFEKAASQNYAKPRLYLAYIHFTETFKYPKSRDESEEMYCKRLFANYELILKLTLINDRSRYRFEQCLFIKSGLLLHNPTKKKEAEQLALNAIMRTPEQSDCYVKLTLGLINLYGSLAQALPQQHEKEALAYFAGLSQALKPGSYKACLAKFLYLFINRDNPHVNVDEDLKQLVLPLDTTHYLPMGNIEEWLPIEYKHILQKPSGEFKKALKAFTHRFNKANGYEVPAEVKQSSSANEPLVSVQEELTPLSEITFTPKEKSSKELSQPTKARKRLQAKKGGTFKAYFSQQSADTETFVNIIKPKPPATSKVQKPQPPQPKSWRDDWMLLVKNKNDKPAITTIPDQKQTVDPFASMRAELQKKANAAPSNGLSLEQKFSPRRMSANDIERQLSQWQLSNVDWCSDIEIQFSAEFSNLLITAKLAKQGLAGVMLAKTFLATNSKQKYSDFVQSLQLLDKIQTLTDLDTNLRQIYKTIQTQKLDQPTTLSHHHYQLMLTFFKDKFAPLIKSSAGAITLETAYHAVVETLQFNGLRKEINLTIWDALGIGDESRWFAYEMKLSPSFAAKLLKLGLAKYDKPTLKLARNIFSGEMGGHSSFIESLIWLDGLNTITDFHTHLAKIFDAISKRILDKPPSLSEMHYQQLLRSFEVKFRFFLKESADTSEFTKAYQTVVNQDITHGELNKSICHLLGLDAKYKQTAMASSRFFTAQSATTDQYHAQATTWIDPQFYYYQLYWQYLCQSQAFIPYVQYCYYQPQEYSASSAVNSTVVSEVALADEELTRQQGFVRRGSCHF